MIETKADLSCAPSGKVSPDAVTGAGGQAATSAEIALDVANDRGEDLPHEELDVGQRPERMQRELAAALKRIEKLETDRETLREKYQSAIHQRDRHRAAVDALVSSKSYRLGRILVLLVKDPIRTSVRLASAIARRILRRLPTPRPVAAVRQATDGSPAQSAAAVTVVDHVQPQPKGADKAGAGSESPAKRKAAVPQTPQTPKPVLSERLPVHAYIALGFDLDSLRSLASAVGQCALVAPNHVPLIVTDVPSFSLLRDTGLAIEYIPKREILHSHREDLQWDRFLADRIAELLRVHVPSKTFFVSKEKPLGLAQLLALSGLDAPKQRA